MRTVCVSLLRGGREIWSGETDKNYILLSFTLDGMPLTVTDRRSVGIKSLGFVHTLVKGVWTMGRLYINGEILTLNAEDEVAEAVLTREGEIYFVGSLDDALSLADLGTEVLDLGGRTLLSLSAYRLLSRVARIARSYAEVPSLLRALGGACLEWGASSPLVVLAGRLVGCPPARLTALLANGEQVCRKYPLAESGLLSR